MGKFEIRLPKMGESVAEATITSWMKEVGDTIELDEALLEIATDKVDTEVPSEVAGVLLERRFEVDDVVAVGDVIAVIQIEGEDSTLVVEDVKVDAPKEVGLIEKQVTKVIENTTTEITKTGDSGRFYSPLVRNISKTEGVSMEELELIIGSGKDGRVTKDDLLKYIDGGRVKSSDNSKQSSVTSREPLEKKQTTNTKPQTSKPTIPLQEGDEIIAMTRMGKMISHHMVASVQSSAHVQSFVEVDVTNVVKWRNRIKEAFLKREGEKITFTPIFMQAIAKALKDYPMMNISLDGDNIIKKKNINLGMAAALPDGNLIVPVIKNADQLNLVGMTKQVNSLANKARNGKLSPDDIQGGTYTVTNVGGFGSIMGTPIINQPQVGILALGAIRKTPAVIETPDGDFIGIRYKMYLSHSYDHRVVNGALGGMFVKKVADYLEAWDANMDF